MVPHHRHGRAELARREREPPYRRRARALLAGADVTTGFAKSAGSKVG
jgi:hypothetical protein